MRKVSLREVLPYVFGVAVSIAAIVIFYLYDHPPLSEPWFINESSAVGESAASVKEDNVNPADSGNIKSGANSAGISSLGNGYSAVSAYGEMININTATVSELMTLDGIGEVKAMAIVEYREAHGKFNSIEELTRVSGIGAKTLEKNRARITI